MEELLGRYSNQEHQVENLLRILSLPPTGQKPRPRRSKQIQVRLSRTDIDHLIELYLAGLEINDLAHQFGIARTTVMKHVERVGAPRRRGVIVEHLDEARKLYEQGWSLARVGEHFGVDPSTVGYTFRNEGVPRRDSHGRG